MQVRHSSEQATPLRLIIMSDSRQLFPGGAVPTDMNLATKWQLVAATNLLYARRHGYDFMYLQLEENGCDAHLNVTIRRHPAWCKLLAVEHMSQSLPANTFLMFLDSDAAYYNHTLSFEQFMAQADFEKNAMWKGDARKHRNWGEHPYSDIETARMKAEVPLFLFSNYPYPAFCSGSLVFRMPVSDVLATWWKRQALPRLGNKDMWEQDALRELNLNSSQQAIFNSPQLPTQYNLEMELGTNGVSASLGQRYIAHFAGTSWDKVAPPVMKHILAARQIPEDPYLHDLRSLLTGELLGRTPHARSLVASDGDVQRTLSSMFASLMNTLYTNHTRSFSKQEMEAAAAVLEK